MRRLLTLLLLALLTTAADAKPSLFGYQPSSQYYGGEAGGQGGAVPRIRVMAQGVREVRFELRPVTSPALRAGELDPAGVTTAPPVHTHVERHAGRRWKNPATGLSHGPGGTIEGEYRIPVRDDGIFLLTVTAGNLQLRYLYVISPLAMVVKHTRSEVRGFVVDQASGYPVPRARVKVWTGGGTHWTGRTADDGTFRLALQRPLTDRLTVLAERRGLLALYSEAVYGKPVAREAVYLFTDRPLYRGGHTVYFKGTLTRAGELVPGQAVTVEIRDPRNRVIQEFPLMSSMTGSFHGAVELPGEASSGDYNIVTVWGERRFYDTFTVRQYRKPAFEVAVRPASASLIAGTKLQAAVTATTFTGQPVASGRVRVTVTAAPRAPRVRDEAPQAWGLQASPLLGAPEKVLEQDGVLDAEGRFLVVLDTKPAQSDMTYAISATVTDSENRSAGGGSSVAVTRAGIELAAWTSRDLVAPEDELEASVRATTIDGKPVAVPVTVTLERAAWGRKSTTWTVVRSAQVATDAEGRATWRTRPGSGGYFRVVATAADEAGRATSAQAFFWTSGGTGPGSGLASLEIISDRRAYAPGDKARFLVSSGLKDAHAYVSIEGSRIHEQRVIRLEGSTASFEVPVSADHVPGFYVHVSIVHRGQFVGGAIALSVPDPGKVLSVEVEPDQPVHRPGEEATYRVRITDARGNPVQTEFALAVVDEALLALQADATVDPRMFFYGRRQNEVVTGYTVPREVTGGAYQKVPGRQPTPLVRTSFKDTAYWNPVLVTGPDGTALVRVTLPDNLTRWKGTVRAVAPDIRVGVGTTSLVARKDLMIRLAAPRFLRETDRIEVGALVSNLTKSARATTVTLAVDGVEVVDAKPQTVGIPANGSRSVRWQVRVPNASQARLTVSARSDALADAETTTLPVLAYGQEHVSQRSFRVAGDALEEVVTLPPGNPRLVLRLAPSLAAAAFGGVEALMKFPYGCTEQTMSSFLPDVALAQALARLKLPNRRLQAGLPRHVMAGLARLYAFQHADGGWGWWQDDPSDARMTAYVLYGLTLAREAGYSVSPEVIGSGYAWLSEQPGAPNDAYALMLRSVVMARENLSGPQPASGTPPPGFDVLLKDTGRLSPFGLGMLMDALLRAGRQDDARRVLDVAWSRAVTDGPFLYWRPDEEGGQWGGNAVEATSAVLSAAARLAPDDERVAKAVAWLMQQRTGSVWVQTRATSMAILALTEVMQQDAGADFRAQVLLDGKPVATVSAAGAWDAEQEVVLRDVAPGRHELRFVKEGRGSLYVSREARGFAPGEPQAAEHGIGVERIYGVRDATGQWVKTSKAAPGQDVRVALMLTTASERSHVMIEDWLPSGFEVHDVVPGGLEPTRRDILDDRVALFFTRLPAGTTVVTYEGHFEQAGDLHAMPARAEMMYYPSVSGQTGAQTLEVRP